MASARPCFSLRESLVSQGVTTEDALRSHLEYVYFMEKLDPSFPVRNYKVDPNVPNKVPDFYGIDLCATFAV